MIYLDNNATTPCLPEVIRAMEPYWDKEFGNPSSPHVMGRKALHALRNARSQVASLINCEPYEIIFTGGATESNNLLFLGILLSKDIEKKQIVTSQIEHKSVLEPLKLLEKFNFNIIKLPVSSKGIVDLQEAKKYINTKTLLVSIQTANNEIGTIQPVKELAELAHNNGAYFHTDASQAVGKIPFDVDEINCDFASFSAHKLYGPKGIGALFIRGGEKRWPWEKPFRGGKQEFGMRPGTENVPAIVGFGEACRLAKKNLEKNSKLLKDITIHFSSLLKKYFPEAILITDINKSIPGILSICFPYIQTDILFANLPSICFSNSAACVNEHETSHVLSTIFSKDSKFIQHIFRISFKLDTSYEELNNVINQLRNVKNKVKNNA